MIRSGVTSEVGPDLFGTVQANVDALSLPLLGQLHAVVDVDEKVLDDETAEVWLSAARDDARDGERTELAANLGKAASIMPLLPVALVLNEVVCFRERDEMDEGVTDEWAGCRTGSGRVDGESDAKSMSGGAPR